MNKKLVALAVAGAVASPLAAQAQTANVTLYGRVNIDLEFVQGKINTAGSTPCAPQGSATCTINDPWISRVSSNSSRIGVRGEENLGGGLKAIFQIESSVSTDTGGGIFGSRDTFAGLSGSWGTFRIGNFLAPYDDLHPIFGNVPTYTTSILSTAALWANGTLSKRTGGFDARLPNSLRWDSATVGGFKGGVQISLVENCAGRDSAGACNSSVNYNDTGWIGGGGVNWTAGPLTIAGAFEYQQDARNVGALTAVSQPSTKDWAAAIAASWTVAGWKLAGIYERIDYSGLGADFHRDFFALSGTGKLGPGTFYVMGGWAGDNKGSGLINAGDVILRSGSNTGAWQGTVSYTYDLSKRTSVYAGYNYIKNDSNANYTFNINPYPVQPGSNVQGAVFGMLHTF